MTPLTLDDAPAQAGATDERVPAQPAATRASAVSTPWSTLLRTRCVSGSAIISTIDLSSSVSPPLIASSMSLPSDFAESRTTR